MKNITDISPSKGYDQSGEACIQRLFEFKVLHSDILKLKSDGHLKKSIDHENNRYFSWDSLELEIVARGTSQYCQKQII